MTSILLAFPLADAAQLPAPAWWLARIFVFLLGLTVGSFLNVCIYRLPRELSIISPPSHCPACGTRLSGMELIPLVSQLALRGRCRHCGAPISFRYFAVELVTALVFLGLFVAHGPSASFLAYATFAACLIAIFFIDLEHMLIPDQLVIAGLACGLALDVYHIGISHELPRLPLPFTSWRLPLPASVQGIILGYLVFVAIELFSRVLFRKEGMGGGDMKLAAAIGAVLGPGLAGLSFILAVFSGAVLGGTLLAVLGRKRIEYMPFGPFMAVWALAISFSPSLASAWARAAWGWWLSSLSG